MTDHARDKSINRSTDTCGYCLRRHHKSTAVHFAPAAPEARVSSFTQRYNNKDNIPLGTLPLPNIALSY